MSERHVRTPQRPRLYAAILILSALIVAGAAASVAGLAGAQAPPSAAPPLHEET